MRLIISPAKKMIEDFDSFPCRELPEFLPQAQALLQRLRELSVGELKKVWHCSDALMELNLERLTHMDLLRNLTPAVMAYEGIQYRYLAPGVMTDGELAYLQEHLRILSGFYGVLRPFDGVTPYRLEMHAPLAGEGWGNLYEFWGGRIAGALGQEDGVIVNLASREYSRCVSDHLLPGTRFITCVFGEEAGGRIREKGTLCKMARGEMVRYLAQTRGEEPEALKKFCRLGYAFRPELSDESRYVFSRPEEKSQREE